MYEQKPETAFAVHEDSPDYGGGYVKLYRDALTHRYFTNTHLWHFYLYCILRATYTERKVMIGFQSIQLAPGQFIFGRNQAAIDTGLTVQNIRTCLKVLEKEEKLTIKVTSKFSIISVTNFSSWQNGNCGANHQTNQQLTSNQPATNHKQEGKERKEEHTGKFPDAANVFEKCWAEYPRKIGKEAAMKHFYAQVKSVEEARQLFVSIQNYASQVEGKDPQYIKHGSAFFNKLWRDYVE